MKLGIYSKGIWDIKHLAAFLPEYELVFAQKADAVCGWGRKATADKPREISLRENIPFISLEDGFLRSYDLGVSGAAPLSIVVDRKGIYYDATCESELEDLIKQGATAAEIKRAEGLIEEIKQRKLTKYNHNITQWQKPVAKPCVLVVDQCFGDLSIKYGLATQESFDEMLALARRENPHHHILVKTHPDVIAGKRLGYIDARGVDNCTVIAENINPYTLFSQVEKVYVATSMLGFEALMYGLPVKCFGMPFYAGWGVTDDIVKCERRNVRRNAAEIFAAAYLKYSRYVNPYTGEKCEIEDVVETLSFLKTAYAKIGSSYAGYGFSRWKRYFLKPYLKTPGNGVVFRKFLPFAIKKARQNNAALVIWAAKEKPDLVSRANGLAIHRMEDGFIRSVGLGSDFTVASSLILDKTGIHFDHSRPSDIENMLNHKKFDAATLVRAKNLRELILAKAITKYNTEKNNAAADLPKGKKLILAVGQVEGDASIRLGSPVMKTNQQLVDAIRQDNPDAFIIYKPHPDVISGNRKGAAAVINNADMVISNVGIHSLIKRVDEVHTITSLVGFEALMHGKKVVVYGLPFYAGWGLSVDKISHARRTRKRNIDELVVAALLEYPRYFDFDANLPCIPEVVVEKLSKKPLLVRKVSKVRRIRNGIAGIFRA